VALNSTRRWRASVVVLGLTLSAAWADEAPKQDAKAVELLKAVDAASKARDAISAKVVVAETLGDQKILRAVDVFSAENNTALILLVTAPKSVAGTGYLRVENNLWSYDPGQGRWERRTNRERLSGTNMRTSDLSAAPLSDSYDPVLDGEEKTGNVRLRKLVLNAKPGSQVLFPKMVIWVTDEALERKREEYSESGKLLRTSYVTKTMKVHSPAQNADLNVPAEVKLVDEVEKDRQSVLQFKAFTLGPVPPNTFTKGWLEGKSR